MAIRLAAIWMSDAAAAFDAFLGDASGVAIFAADDLATEATPATRPGVDLTTTVTSLPDVGADIRAAIRAAWASAMPAEASSAATTAEGVTTSAATPTS